MIEKETNKNPLFETWNTPHETAPFDKIKTIHFETALLKSMEIQKAEIDFIIQNKEAASFENTIEALEKSGTMLNRISGVFSNLLSAETNDEMDAIAEKIMPILSQHSNDINLNEPLFIRVKEVYQQKDSLSLNEEQLKLLEDTYDGFIRSGANLNGEDKKKYRNLTEQLSIISLQYSQNILKETNSYSLLISKEENLKGIPESALEAAVLTAKETGAKGWVFTLNAPSYMPLMKYAKSRTLRKELYLAYNTRCTHDNKYNNFENVKQIVNLKMKIAQILGFKNYADYALQRRMAENEGRVHKLLDDLLTAYRPKADKEVKDVENFAKEIEGDDFVLAPWDWGYYANLLREKTYHFNEEELRPYFELKKVIKGVFGLATTLYGISFKEKTDIPVYHPDVKAFEVFDRDGSYLAVLYTDFFPRKGKRAGAWMTSFKEQWKNEKGNSRPHVSLVMNFTKPTETKPALLTFGEVETFLHEFGHALHGMFANTNYSSLSGTNVYWDFVELPSQFMENFAKEQDFLNTFAYHYQTGKQIPHTLVQKIIDASNYGCGYACLRQLSFSLLDMAWYSRTEEFQGDVQSYEQQAMATTKMLPIVQNCCMSVQFSHIFAGGYSAGYYSYKWAEVIDADAFSLFKEKGIFNKELAQSFRDNILSRGGTENPMVLYKRFRGKDATVDALLQRNGIK
jgi:peptidyl-dipeptidase Dcp